MTWAKRRGAAGVAVVTTPKSAIVPILERIGLPHRTLLVQESGALPLMRPPILLDTLGLRPLVLARVLDNLAGGRLHGWKAGQPIPTIAIVGVRAYAHQRLLACSPAIAAVISEQVNPLTLPVCMHHIEHGPIDQRHGPLWFGLSAPGLPEPRPDLCGLLLALGSAAKLHDVAAAWHVSRATFFRRLDAVCAALGLARPAPGCPAERWLATLLEALEQPF